MRVCRSVGLQLYWTAGIIPFVLGIPHNMLAGGGGGLTISSKKYKTTATTTAAATITKITTTKQSDTKLVL